MPAGFPVKADYAAGDILTATNMNDLASTLNYLDPTAKGDLFPATSGTALGRLAVGSNGFTLVADSAASTGLNYSGTTQGNPTINGAFDIWQRGTSRATTGGTDFYVADRFYSYRGGSVTGSTVSRQSTNDTTNLPFIQYCARVQRDSGNTSTQPLALVSDFESTNSIPYAGRTITLSFYARAGANYSPTSSALAVSLFTGTGTDQAIRNGYTNQTTAISQTATLTTTWQRFSYTATLGATITQIGLYFLSTPTGTAGANDWYEITGIQIDLGSTALPFRRSGGTIQGELAACQRYYYRQTATGQAYARFGIGPASSTTNANILLNVPSQLRIASGAAVDYSTLGLYTSGSPIAVTSLTLDQVSTTTYAVNAVVASGLTQDRSYLLLANNSANAYIGISAEL